MLPFLRKRHEGVATGGVIIKNRQPDETPKENDHDTAIHSCAADLISAVHAHDIKAAAEAIRSAFEILDAMPHQEYSHKEDEDEIV